MNLLISVDMEGIAGVVSVNHTLPKHPEYRRFRSIMTAETNAAIDGGLAGGAERIVVSEGHEMLTNLLIEELNPVAELAAGLPVFSGQLEGIDPDIDAVFLLGYHAASGTGRAVQEHTLSSSSIFQVKLNGQEMGEIGLSAALAGSYGVPITLVTGDDVTVAEARALLGDIETVTTKKAISHSAALCLHPTIVQEKIRQAAERAVKIKAEPFVVTPPITVSVTFQRALHADFAAMIPGSRRIDGRTLEWTGQEMPVVYQALETMMAISWLANVIK